MADSSPVVPRAAPAGMQLELRHVDAFYGGAQALFDVSIQVDAGEFVVLQGLNGAGKSTLLKAAMGMEVRTRGQVLAASAREGRHDGARLADMSDWETHRRAQAGLGYVAEDRRLFTGLTVLENLHIAATGDAQAQQARVLALFPALKPMLGRPAAHMSGGEQQMLAIARTLMTRPRILLLDEPCEGIAPVLVESIRHALLALKREGMAMLVAEQNQLLAASADRLILLVAGKVRGALPRQ